MMNYLFNTMPAIDHNSWQLYLIQWQENCIINLIQELILSVPNHYTKWLIQAQITPL